MEPRSCRWIGVAERRELWRRWRAGESLCQISQALGRRDGSVHSVLRSQGGFSPAERRRSPRVLSLAEREEISRGVIAGQSVRQMARGLGRAPSTISREIARHGGRSVYRANRADARAWQQARRPKRCRLAQDHKLCSLVASRLSLRWSPQQISTWLVQRSPHDHSQRVSHETIYKSLFIQARGALKVQLLQHLRRGHRFRRSVHSAPPGHTRSGIKDPITISERPAQVEDRAVPGHWEGDLLMGGHRSQIATLVERRSRFVILVRIPSKDTDSVVRSLSRQMLRLPQHLRGSLTWDRGTEMSHHKDFTVATDMSVYFCDPHNPWQRGSNENTNGLLRQYFPKGKDLSGFSQAALNRVARQLNDRPRQTLGFRCPFEVLNNTVASTD